MAEKLNTFEKEKGKTLNSKVSRKDLSERKKEKTRMKIMLSASLPLLFSHKVHNIRFEKQIGILSQLTVIDLGPTVSDF